MSFSFKRLTLRQGYILALGIISIVAVLKCAAMEVLVMRQDDSAVVINISGRQRMLSQQTAFFTLAYSVAKNDMERERIRSNLLRVLDEFEANHKDLIEGNASRGLRGVQSPAMRALYGQYDGLSLDDLVKNYVGSVHTVLNGSINGEEENKALAYIFEIGPTILVDRLNGVVDLYQQEARNDVQFLLNLQKIFLLVTLMVLLLEAFFLFLPMERRVAEEMDILRAREEKIKNKFIELERFMRVIALDLQDPLRKIADFADYLGKVLDGRLSEKESAYIGFISSGSSRVREIVSGLNAYASLSVADGYIETVNVDDVVHDVLHGLSDVIEENQIKVTCAALPVLSYNKMMLGRIFENLIGNAIKYKGDVDPVIEISAEKDEQGWVFCVSDNGIGMSEKLRARILAMSQGMTREWDELGAGFGLPMVKKIVERHGGKIWVESVEGKGSKFYFTIPISAYS